jgi:hypothetical protein
MNEYSNLKLKINNILKIKKYDDDVINHCENTITHIHNILSEFTNMSNIEVLNECNNAFMYYIEFIKQLKDNNNNEIHFTEVDINLFIFNKIFKGIVI